MMGNPCCGRSVAITPKSEFPTMTLNDPEFDSDKVITVPTLMLDNALPYFDLT